MYYTYILYSVKFDRYYIGHCENLANRLLRHNNKMVTSTKSFVPWEVVYFEAYNSKSEANKRELYIKKYEKQKVH